MTGEEELDIARALADAGIPIFVAYPDPDKAGEFKPPRNWQNTQPNRSYIDAWQPGLALCAVMGCGIDLVDIDPRNGGDIAQIAHQLHDVIASATTPSGGRHVFVTSMDVGSRDSVLPGIDIKAGDAEGHGRGFAFIAPTIRVSKTTGELTPYRWSTPPDMKRVNGHRAADSRLADLVRGARQTTTLFTSPDSTERKHTGPIPYGEHHSRLIAYAGWLRSKALPLQPEAETLMRRRWQDLIQPADASRPKYTEDEAIAELRDIYSRYAAGDPGAEQAAPEALVSPGEFAAVDWTEAFSTERGHIDWLLEPLLERGTLNVLYGPPGVGKSLVALELAAQLSTSGHRILYMDHENRITDVVERLRDMDYGPDDLGNLRFYSFAALPALDTFPGGLKLSALASAENAGLVVIDTTMRMVAGKENDSDTINNLYRYSLVPLKAQQITVLRLDHPGKDETRGQRGSSAKTGDVDTVWRLSGRVPQFRLDREKSRSSHGFDTVTLIRTTGPLQHTWSIGGQAVLSERSVRILKLLDSLDVPKDAGRDSVRPILAERGEQIANDQLGALLRYRRTCPGQVADRSDGLLSAVPTRSVGQQDRPGPDSTTPFRCETCGGMHPIAEHSSCRQFQQPDV